ncbi:MFS transporter [Picrophilus oshimae]|uniref:Sugar transporter n=1 Tax=Picrophilus torridus (strain ATCC 700027 / DSM 9790 / JCM 10055 / NBRC 100828 / KAW 2/3) TaxID=1122961 RepID=A0A8G2FVN5_PICTO|nr:MFS transporter [Picrophilus oshimae]SMD30331.1 Sugar transporter [Picrophilus oshimae DSM 9789]
MSDIYRDLDEKRFGWFHLKSMITTGMGVFTDGYDLSSIGLVLLLVLSFYGIGKSSPDYTIVTSLLAGSALIGAAVGAIVFGELARRGRKRFYGIDVAILGIGALLQALSPNITFLIVIRFILGLGVGADYVLSPMIMAEHSNSRDRGKTIAFGFGLMWGFGATLAAVVYLLIAPLVSPDLLWRIVLSAGAMPALAVVYLRRRMPETPRFIARIVGDKDKFINEVKYIANREIKINGEIKDNNTFMHYFKRYAGFYITAMILWFLYDQIAYSSILFGPSLIASGLGIPSDIFQFVMELAFTIPGGIVAVSLIDRVGRKPLQVSGFILMGVFLLSFGILKDFSLLPAFLGLMLYGMQNFANQYGPGSISASGMLGVELAPTKIRSQIQSYTVAAGRTGASLSSFVFPYMFIAFGESFAFYYLTALAIIAGILTWVIIPETKGSLEKTSGELNEMRNIEVIE